jgi:hypothetical protein
VSRTIRPQCLGTTYRHFFVSEDTTWDEPDSLGVQMREITLRCARCGLTIWIDTTIRPYLGLRSDDDWGT